MTAQWEAVLVTEDEQEAWDSLLQRHYLARSIVPMWEEQAGWTSHRIGLFAGNQLVGGLMLAVRKVPALPFRLGRISCAMVGPNRHAEMLDVLLAEVEHFAEHHAIIEIELRLRIPATVSLPEFQYHREIRRALDVIGYRAIRKMDHTYLVRIDRSNEEVLRSFSSMCRRSIRKAIKSGAEIALVTDVQALDKFYASYTAMCERKNVKMPNIGCVVDGIKPLIEKGHVLFFIERYSGQLSNMVLIDALGIPCYMLGTRTKEAVEGEVPSHAQALHYHIMRYMRDRGSVYYDLGGCEGPEPKRDHPNYGVWHFKYGFRGEYVDFLPYFRKARGPLTRRLLNLAHRIRGDYV